jgi:probable F420-dependent oxidoreductase
VKLGLLISPGEGSLNEASGQPDRITLRFDDIRLLACEAEASGLDSFWLSDHLLFREPSLEVGRWETFTFLAGLAASTTRITLGPLVAATPFRNPGLLAKMADSLDEISSGRFVLGLGCGWHEPEFRAFGYPFDRRVERFGEAVQIIVPLLRTGRVNFRGRFYQATDATLRPRGPSPAGPPIWIGARRPRMLRLAAQYADAWNSDKVSRPEQVTRLVEDLHAACTAVGRDPATLGVTAFTAVRITVPTESSATEPTTIVGTVEEVAAALRAFVEVGVQHMIVAVEPPGLKSLERFARVRELVST